MSSAKIELSVVLPCLNEAETLQGCIADAKKALRKHSINGEIILADNGSTDDSVKIARKEGIRVVHVPRKGYGSALMGGIEKAKGEYVIMCDADGSYDFSHIPRFLKKLREGYDLVMGNRFAMGIEAGAMPFSHRIGNPILSGIGRLFFYTPIRDFHCGLRGFSKEAFRHMKLRTRGMEFASEMIVKASLLNMRITEVPTTLFKDGRTLHSSHLHTWRDGWRHLRFMLLYCPRWLLFYPGIACALAGGILAALILFAPNEGFWAHLGVHSLLYSSVMVVIGVEMITFSHICKTFAVKSGLYPHTNVRRPKKAAVPLEAGLVAGGVLLLGGLCTLLYAFLLWKNAHFQQLDPVRFMYLVIPSCMMLVLGSQIVLSSFLISIVGINRD